MATVSLNGFDFQHMPWWTTVHVSASESEITLWQEDLHATFRGSFEFDEDDLEVEGTVLSFSMDQYFADSQGYVDVGSYSYVGEHLDASKIRDLVFTPNGAQAFQAFVLKGNDRFENASGGVILGYAGNDVFLASGVGGTINGGSGVDTYVAPASMAGVSADLTAGRVTSLDRTWPGSARLISVENLQGSSGNDVLGGTAASNRLDGRAGVDTVSYASASASVQVDLAHGSTTGGGGADVLVSIENATGGTAADVLIGSSGANVLDGGAGADSLRGGLGNDTYVVNQSGDVLFEAAGAGTDTVKSAISLTLGSQFENLVLLGTANSIGVGNAAANRLVGNAGNNRLDGAAGADRLEGGVGSDRLAGGTEADLLYGGAGNDTLDGGQGNDTLSGGSGDDAYVVNSSADRLMEDAQAGRDIVRASVSAVLPVNIEELSLTGTANLNATGNAAANVLRGNAGANVLNGLAGADVMIGGAGNDRYVVDDAQDRCVEAAGGGVDKVEAAVTYTLGEQVENLVLAGMSAIDGTGNSLANQIIGNSAANMLNGGAGSDTMTGGAGNDLYAVNAAGDVVRELAGQGIDWIRASVSYVLDAEVEKISLTGSASIRATGNALANSLTGNAGDNRLDGGAGADSMAGGQGNDTYVVDSSRDVVSEVRDQGTDLVIATVSYTLQDEVEKLTLAGGAAIDGTGNRLANTIVGNASLNVLDGGGGSDTLIGGAGDDTYRVSTGAEVIVEATNGGTDTVVVQGPFFYQLADHVENGVLAATFSGCRLAGNALANRLTGSAHADRLDGHEGSDTMIGGDGGDMYAVDSEGDVVIELAGVAGRDQVTASIDYTAALNIEDISLVFNTEDLNATGNALRNSIHGNRGDNVLDGAAGNDTLYGGDGSDTYIVDSLGDQAIDEGYSGIDTVYSSVEFDLQLGYGLENLVLTGAGHLDGRGTAGANVLSGNAGDNLLDGRGGLDTVNYANATVGIQVDLGAGTASGFGSDVLLGFENVIGSSFDDLLRGDAGANRLQGGVGADRFVLDSATAADTVADFVSGVDTLAISQATLSVGNGDLQVDGAVTLAGPGGFDTGAELVVVQAPVPGTLDTAAAAAAIGGADSAYADGQSALFAVVGAAGVGVYRFTSADGDAVVDADELTVLATLEGSSSFAAGDVLWVP